MEDNLLKNIDIEKLADEGERIYEKVKSQYEPQGIGKYLAIEVDSKDVYLGETSNEAVDKAKKDHPDKIFFVVKIGYSANDILSKMEQEPKRIGLQK